MRKKNREITNREELLAIIRKCDVCRLALYRDDYPYIVPLNFGVEVQDDQIYLYFHSAGEGLKLDLLHENNHVGFEMDCNHRLDRNYNTGMCTMHYESVIGTGTAELLPDQEKKHALSLLFTQYPGAPEDPDLPIPEKALPYVTAIRVKVDSLTGKRG